MLPVVLYAPATVTCSSCASENPPEARFCLQCGSPLAVVCAACRTPNVPHARFCISCGTSLQGIGNGPSERVGTPPADGSPARRDGRVDAGTERRMVSVLFADLVGFTALSSTRDHETMRELQSAYFVRSTEIVTRYGGTVEKFIGDALMAVWGTPVAHEDDPERAVRAALDLVDAIPVLGRSHAVALQLRAGVLTGEAAVALGVSNEGMVTGDMVNTAARLQAVAPPGGVLVGETTRAATDAGIAYEDAGEHELKGKDRPVRAWRALNVVGTRAGARLARSEPPFVGRTEELRFLKEQFHSVAREQHARLVSLVGQAGIGKSRIAWELEKYLDGVIDTVLWHRGRAPSYGEGVTFWALGEMIRRRAGLAEGDDEATTRTGITTMLEAYVRDEDERSWIEPRLLALLGLGDHTSGGHEELFAAWRTFFERLAEHGTVALVVEDLQWSDDGMLDFLEHLLDWARSSAILVLTLSRPEVLERRPGWGTDRRGAISMRLEPLSDAAMRELLAGIAPGLSGTHVERVLRRADGIPLYAVETVRMLLGSGRLVERDGGLVVVGEIDNLDIPPTLHALVAARLDRLPPADRSLLQVASVLGQSFTVAALAAMTGEPEDALVPRLTAFVRQELLTIETDPRAPTRGQHAFVQALVREVAYGTLARRDRRARHLAAARYFEAMGDDELAGAIATHFLAAYQAAPDGPEGEAAATQARISLIATADRAATLGALGQAITALRSAMAVTREPADRARLLERIGWVCSDVGRWDEAHEALRDAVALHLELGDGVGAVRACGLHVAVLLGASQIDDALSVAEKLRAEAEAMSTRSDDREAAEAAALFAEAMGRASFRAFRPEAAVAWSDRALRLAESLALDDVIAQALVTKGSACMYLGRGREGLALLEGAFLDAKAHGQHEAMLRAANNLASFLIAIDPRAALDRVRDAWSVARRLGMAGYDSYLAGNASGAAEWTGQWEEASALIGSMAENHTDAEALEWFEHSAAIGAPWRGTVDLDTALTKLAERTAAGDLQSVANISSFLSAAALASGRLDDAVVHAQAFLDAAGTFLPPLLPGIIGLHAGDRQLAERALAAAPGVGGAAVADARVIEGGLAALDRRRPDAVQLYRTALASYRELGCDFSLALAVFSMVVMLGAEETTVRAVVPEARKILIDLDATALVGQLDAAAAAGDPLARDGGNGYARELEVVATPAEDAARG